MAIAVLDGVSAFFFLLLGGIVLTRISVRHMHHGRVLMEKLHCTDDIMHTGRISHPGRDRMSKQMNR